jgi:predicted Rossmann fold flavoprotein
MQIAVIGGGAAGFMAAISAAENSPDNISIDIYEKNIPLKTILYTGNGRCNLSNEIYDYKELAANFPRGEKFLYSAFSKFGVAETLEWLNKHGLKTYTQEDNRIFPQSDKAADVRNLFLSEAKKHNINIYAGVPVKTLEKNNEKFLINKERQYDKVILATGGSKDGTLGGCIFAKNFGHTIKELKPSLTALRTSEKFVNELAGVSIKSAEITSMFENKQITKFRGDFVFTHKGISGPVVFKTSAYCCYLNYSIKTPLILKINFLAEKSAENLERDILEELKNNSQKNIGNILKNHCNNIPKSLLTTLFKHNEIDSEKKASQITKEDRKKIISMLVSTNLTVISPEPDGEIVTAGGVDLKKINPKTMESKLVSGLYFCGEVMDIDGLTGGFNLQSCWSTGFIAGNNTVQK